MSKFLKITLLFACFFIFLHVREVKAEENNRGVSYILEMCHKKTDCQSIKNSFKDADVMNIGWMYGVSNELNRCKCSKKILKDSKKKRVRVHLTNSTCFPERGRKCESHEVYAGLTAKKASKQIINNNKNLYKKLDIVINKVKEDIKISVNTEWAISPCLECTLTTEARQKLYNYVKNSFKDFNIKMVDNPLSGSCLDNTELCEKHGNVRDAKKNIITDLDGVDYDGIDQVKYLESNNKAWLNLTWKYCCNGTTKDSSGSGYVAPMKRTNWCSNRDVLDFASVTGEDNLNNCSYSKKDLKGCDKIVDMSKGDGAKKGFILKLGDGKSYSVLLLPSSYDKMEKVELWHNGKKIDESVNKIGKRFGQFYAHDPKGSQRRIYDFQKHPYYYSNCSILRVDDGENLVCFKLEKPKFRID